VRVVGFVMRIYHDALSPERQNLNCFSPTFFHGETPKIISLSRGNPTYENVYRPENVKAGGSLYSSIATCRTKFSELSRIFRDI